eukprot:GABV01000753.1.p1 GENE.GABV01000753.1~~GABV01000753.1.p1  ORF type:complete len:275 (+),score=42.52 GABV01000753.1:263-1087(+)
MEETRWARDDAEKKAAWVGRMKKRLDTTPTPMLAQWFFHLKTALESKAPETAANMEFYTYARMPETDASKEWLWGAVERLAGEQQFNPEETAAQRETATGDFEPQLPISDTPNQWPKTQRVPSTQGRKMRMLLAGKPGHFRVQDTMLPIGYEHGHEGAQMQLGPSQLEGTMSTTETLGADPLQAYAIGETVGVAAWQQGAGRIDKDTYVAGETVEMEQARSTQAGRWRAAGLPAGKIRWQEVDYGAVEGEWRKKIWMRKPAPSPPPPVSEEEEA